MRKTAYFFMIFVLLAAGLGAAGSEKASVAIIPLKTSEGVAEQELVGFTTFLEGAFLATDSFRIIAQNERDTILDEQAFSLSGCADQTCAVEIGQLLSADFLIMGSINKSGSRYIVSINLMSVESGEIEKNAIVTLYSLSTIEELRTKCQELANIIAGKEGASGYSSRRQVEAYTGSISFSVTPADAVLTFNLSTEYTEFPATIEDFPVGEYPIRVNADGFLPHISAVSVEKGETKEINITLEPSGSEIIVPEKGKGFLNIYTSPPGMDVMVDYQMIQGKKTPLLDYELEAGEHIISVGDITNNFYGTEDDVPIEIIEGETIERSFELPRNTGRLMITSNVADAEVFINGKAYGYLSNGRLMLPKVECGESEINLFHEKYEAGTFLREIRPFSSNNNEVNIQMTPLPVALIIDSNPQGAEVYLNYEVVGKTPLVLDDVTQDDYAFSLAYNGYETPQEILQVTSTEDITLIKDLTNSVSFVFTDPNEEGAYVYMDGKENPSGQNEGGELTLSHVSVGTHIFRIEKKGYGTMEKRVTVIASDYGSVDDVYVNLSLDDIPYTITSQPGGADIYLDGVDTELQTPATIRLSEGTHEIILSKLGFLRLKETIVVDSTRGGMVRLSLPEGTDETVLMEYFQESIANLGTPETLEDYDRNIAEIDGFIEQLSAYDVETSSINKYLLARKADLQRAKRFARQTELEEKVAALENRVENELSRFSGLEYRQQVGDMVSRIEALSASLYEYDFSTTQYETRLHNLKQRLDAESAAKIAEEEEAAGQLRAAKDEIEVLEAEKRKLDTWSVVLGLTTAASLGGTGYFGYEAVSSYDAYLNTEFSDEALDYRDAVNTYTMAGTVGLSLSLVTGIIELFVLRARRNVIDELDAIRSQKTSIGADMARTAAGDALGGLNE